MKLGQAVLGVLLGVFAFLAHEGARAEEDCNVPPEAGTWYRSEPAGEQELVEIQLIHRCTTNARWGATPLPGAEWTVRAFARCRPRNCIWGREKADAGESGDLVAVFLTFSARRALRIEPFGDTLRVDIAIDYHTDARDDEITSGVIFLRRQ
ncbi:MAG: hypothetical protein KDJ46_08095 [Rhodobiaceae bacterium]|nr:hypothetical protein [Rhodobiaceae bacterium]